MAPRPHHHHGGGGDHHARAALDAIAGVRAAIDETTGLLRGRVAVGMVVACGLIELPGLLAGFNRDHPAVEIALSEANSDRLVSSLIAGQLDLAIIGLGITTPAGVDIQVVADERLVAAVSRDHALAGKKAMTVDALSHQGLISLPKGTGLRTAIDEAFAAIRSRPKIAFEASHPNVLAHSPHWVSVLPCCRSRRPVPARATCTPSR